MFFFSGTGLFSVIVPFQFDSIIVYGDMKTNHKLHYKRAGSVSARSSLLCVCVWVEIELFCSWLTQCYNKRTSNLSLISLRRKTIRHHGKQVARANWKETNLMTCHDMQYTKVCVCVWVLMRAQNTDQVKWNSKRGWLRVFFFPPTRCFVQTTRCNLWHKCRITDIQLRDRRTQRMAHTQNESVHESLQKKWTRLHASYFVVRFLWRSIIIRDNSANEVLNAFWLEAARPNGFCWRRDARGDKSPATFPHWIHIGLQHGNPSWFLSSANIII